MSEPVLPKPARVAGTVFVWLLVSLVVVVMGALAWIGARGLAAYDHLQSARSTAAEAADILDDPAQATPLLAELSSDTAQAHALTSDPIWSAAEHLPWLGPQLRAVSTVAATADDVTRTALTPLAKAASGFSIDSFRPVNGTIDTTAFAAIVAPARIGADGVAAAASSVSAVDRTALLPPVRDAIDDFSTLLDRTAAASDALARASALLPSMLGSDGERDYLIVFQNNAEWRSLGGIVGAMAVIHTSDGALELTAQGSTADFEKYSAPVIPLDADREALFGDSPGRWIQNVTQVPDFSVAGELARKMWRMETGLEVDGVIAMDPVALSYLLAATGPIDLAGGDTLSAQNAVELLLNKVYLRYDDPRQQDAFFAAAAASVFTALADGRVDPAKLVAALGRAGDERRLLLWSADSDDQRVLSDTTLAGNLPVTDEDTARFGVYLNDGTGSKMDYYVTPETTVGWESCTVDARGRTSDALTLTLTISNNAPADAATALPRYITGGGQFGVPAGTARTVVYVYVPQGYLLAGAELSTDRGFGGGQDGDYEVVSFSSDLTPGESVTAEISVRPAGAGATTAVAQVTPTVDAKLPPDVVGECGTP